MTVQLSDVVVRQEAKGLDSEIRVNAAALEFDEASDIQWQEFQVRLLQSFFLLRFRIN